MKKKNKTEVKLLFSMERKFDRRGYDGLIKLTYCGQRPMWNPEKKKYIWIFELNTLPEVLKLTNEKIEFDEKDVKRALGFCPPLLETVKKAPWKGKGYFTIIDEAPKYIEIETVISKKAVRKKINRFIVETVWRLIKEYPRKRTINYKTLAERICNALDERRFHRQTGTFDWQKFLGSRGEGYFPFYYFPLKVLEAKGYILHYKTGHVERISDSELTFQKYFIGR